jgi:hypothetical protein
MKFALLYAGRTQADDRDAFRAQGRRDQSDEIAVHFADDPYAHSARFAGLGRKSDCALEIESLLDLSKIQPVPDEI